MEEIGEVAHSSNREADKQGGYILNADGNAEEDSKSIFSHKTVEMHIVDMVNLDMDQIVQELGTYPAEYQQALVHRQANIFGVMEDRWENRDPDTSSYYVHSGMPKVTKNPTDNQKMCGCCFKQEGLRELDLGCNLKELSVFGSGFTMFFQVLTYCIYILTVQFFTSGLFNLVSNIVGDECLTSDMVRRMNKRLMSNKDVDDYINTHNLCKYSFITLLSQGNKAIHHPLLNLCLEVLLMFSIIVIVFLLHYLRNELSIQQY